MDEEKGKPEPKAEPKEAAPVRIGLQGELDAGERRGEDRYAQSDVILEPGMIVQCVVAGHELEPVKYTGNVREFVNALARTLVVDGNLLPARVVYSEREIDRGSVDAEGNHVSTKLTEHTVRLLEG